jgi:hypothetical protein
MPQKCVLEVDMYSSALMEEYIFWQMKKYFLQELLRRIYTNMYNANITIMMRDIPVETEEECVKWLKEYFNELAGSNDGSEFLANLIRKGGGKEVDLDLWEEGDLR